MDRVQLRAVLVMALTGCSDSPECATCTESSPSTLFVTDRGGDAIVRYDGVTGEFRDVFAAGSAQHIDRPSSVRLGPGGDIYLAGFGRGDVVRYDLSSGSMMDVFFQDSEVLEEPVELMFAGDQLFVLGNDTQNLVEVDRQGHLRSVFGDPEMRAAHDFVLGPDHTVYVGVDSHPQLGTAVQVWDTSTGALLRTFGTPDELAAATSMALGPDGLLYVGDHQRDQIVTLDPRTGAARGILVSSASARLATPVSLDFGPDGALYVLDDLGIHRLDPSTGDELSLFVRSDDGHLERPRSFTFITAQAIAAAAP